MGEGVESGGGGRGGLGRVAPEAFTAAIDRLGERGIAFGNDPEDVANGRTDDPLGGAGRTYFRDHDGHLYELVVAPPPV